MTAEVAAQLSRVGVRVRLLIATSDNELKELVAERTRAYIWAWAAEDPDPGGGFLEPFVGWIRLLSRGDDELDVKLARAASLRDQAERLRAYREFERIWIGERAAVVPLVYLDRLLFRRPWVTGMWVNPLAISTFADAVVTRSSEESRSAT